MSENKFTLSMMDDMIIHHTPDSLSRAISTLPFRTVDGDESKPKLTYVSQLDGTVRVHSLVSDLIRFLLLDKFGDKSKEESTPEFNIKDYHTKFKISDNQVENGLSMSMDGSLISISGYLDDDTGDYYVNLTAEFDSRVLTECPDATFKVGHDRALKLSNRVSDNTLLLKIPVVKSEDDKISEVPVVFNWTRDYQEKFTIGFPDGGIVLK